MQEFNWPVRVYYEDTDSGGVVYHSNYLNFMERARTEWLRSLGIGQQVLREQHGVIFAVTHVDVRFVRPACFDDLLDVSCQPEILRAASMCIKQRIVRHEDGTELCNATVKVACLVADSLRPCAMPKHIKTEIERVI